MSKKEIATPTPAPATAPKLTAIQIIEQELQNFIQQRVQAVKTAEQAMANVHAIEGAIQAGQHLLVKLKAEAAKVEVEVEKVEDKVIETVKKEL